MTKYREILRLKSLGFSERNIAHSCGVSRNTVAKVVKKAAEIKLSWPLDHDMTDSTLEEMLFPKTKSATNKRMPDYDYQQPINGCLIMTTSAENFCVMESIRSSCG